MRASIFSSDRRGALCDEIKGRGRDATLLIARYFLVLRRFDTPCGGAERVFRQHTEARTRGAAKPPAGNSGEGSSHALCTERHALLSIRLLLLLAYTMLRELHLQLRFQLAQGILHCSSNTSIGCYLLHSRSLNHGLSQKAG